jgi:hypothetical protein
MTLDLSVHPCYGPPVFYEPPLTIPPASLREIQMATSTAGQSFLKNWLKQPGNIGNTDDWANFLFLMSLASHFNPNWAWESLFPLMARAYETFRMTGFALKTPIALYWPIILAPLVYHRPNDEAILDLAWEFIISSDAVTRVSTVKLLCLSRDETFAKGAMKILHHTLNDPNEGVRAETILSLIKCGPIPVGTQEKLESCLNHPATYLPAASALYHMTGKEEYFAMLQEAAEGRKMQVAREAAHALEPWPTRQCITESCRTPIQFEEYWMEWRKHVSPMNFGDAYQLWRSPGVNFFCCRCYHNISDPRPIPDSIYPK